jgi:hypothetical protein
MNRDDELRRAVDPPSGDAVGSNRGDEAPLPENGRSDSDNRPDDWDLIEVVEVDAVRFDFNAGNSRNDAEDLLQESAPDDDDVGSATSRVEGMPDGWLEPLQQEDAVETVDPNGGDHVADESTEPHSSRVQIGTGHSGISAASDVIPEAPQDTPSTVEVVAFDFAGAVAMGNSNEDRSDAPEGEHGEESIRGAGDEWRDIVADGREEGPSESIGFGAFLGGDDGADQTRSSDSYADDSQGLADGGGQAFDVPGVAGGGERVVAVAPVIAAAKNSAARGGGLGQLVGVVAGGLLAIPVTLAILIWGLGRDPFQLTRQIPESASFLLPAKFRPGQRDARRAVAVGGPALDASQTLDQLPTAGRPADAAGSVPPDVTTAVPAEPSEIAPDGPPGVEDGLPMPVDMSPITDTPAATASMESATLEKERLDVVPEHDVAIDLNSSALVALTVPSPPGIDAAPVRTVDLAALEDALARATIATAEVDLPSGSGNPEAHDHALVGWYRALSEVAVRLAGAERASMEAGLSETAGLDRYVDFRRELLGSMDSEQSTARLNELADLGEMWLGSARRPSDGTILVGILDAVHAVGPWWGGRITVVGETPTTVTFLSRNAPEAAPGDKVMATGVLADVATMWMVDCTAVSTGSAAGTAVSGMVEGDETSDPDAALEGAVPGDDSF